MVHPILCRNPSWTDHILWPIYSGIQNNYGKTNDDLIWGSGSRNVQSIESRDNDSGPLRAQVRAPKWSTPKVTKASESHEMSNTCMSNCWNRNNTMNISNNNDYNNYSLIKNKMLHFAQEAQPRRVMQVVCPRTKDATEGQTRIWPVRCSSFTLEREEHQTEMII